VVEGYVPGALGRLLELQEVYYLDGWGFDTEFVRWTFSELADFVEGLDKSTDRLFVAVSQNEEVPSDERTILGSIVVRKDPAAERLAQVRWFIVDPTARGLGLGRRLFEAAMAFCEDARFEQVHLTTIRGLDAAIHLYEDYGFDLVEEQSHHDWGKTIELLRYEMVL
jgi:ribosomal protein S18 acetylase RimI-like enzyme